MLSVSTLAAVSLLPGDHDRLYLATLALSLPLGAIIPMAGYVVLGTLALVLGVGPEGSGWLLAVNVSLFSAAAAGNVALARLVCHRIDRSSSHHQAAVGSAD